MLIPGWVVSVNLEPKQFICGYAQRGDNRTREASKVRRTKGKQYYARKMLSVIGRVQRGWPEVWPDLGPKLGIFCFSVRC